MAREDEMLFKILDKVSEVSEKVAKVESRCETMEKDINSIKEEDAKQNELLAEHIQGVKSNSKRLDVEIEKSERMFQSIDGRLNSLEEPSKFLKTLKKIAIYISTVGGAGIVIGRLLGMW